MPCLIAVSFKTCPAFVLGILYCLAMADQVILVFGGKFCNSLIALWISQLMLSSRGEYDFDGCGVDGFWYERANRF